MSNENLSLQHYASPYYDPVKAHEYYMRTRELKGRKRSASSLNDEGKKVWEYTKNQISESKKQDLQDASEAKDEYIKELQTEATATRERISTRLKSLSEALASRTAADRAKVAKDNETEIESIENRKEAALKALMSKKIPVEGISKKERAKLLLERSKKIAQIRNDYDSEKGEVYETSNSKIAEINAKTQQESARYQTDAKTERAECSNKLKSAVAAAREAYKECKTMINANYEEVYQEEFDKILSEYSKPKKTKK